MPIEMASIGIYPKHAGLVVSVDNDAYEMARSALWQQ